MSTSSIDPPQSPSRRWLSNHDGFPAASSPKSSEVIAEDGQNDEAKETPSLNYPIDENLFYSAPSQPLADTALDDPSPTHVEEDAREREEEIYEEAVPAQLPHPPDFNPFFTLIADPDTGTHHHPTVHYVFSDDDPELMTLASLASIDAHAEAETADFDGVEERCVVVDMAADGKTVISAASMSPHWQGLKTTVTQAPSWGDGAGGVEKGLMLKVEGKEVGTVGKRRRQGDVEALVREFGERLEGLDGVLGRSADGVGEGDVVGDA